jgi:hypothetical protein
MFRNSKVQAKKVVLNHLMRNIDLEISLIENQLHGEVQRESGTLKLIALAVRCHSEPIHEYFGEDHELLGALPISLVALISAKSEKYSLVKELKIDEDEDLFITLHKPACKQLVGEIIEHIIENGEHYFKMFSHEISRESCFVTFD